MWSPDPATTCHLSSVPKRSPETGKVARRPVAYARASRARAEPVEPGRDSEARPRDGVTRRRRPNLLDENRSSSVSSSRPPRQPRSSSGADSRLVCPARCASQFAYGLRRGVLGCVLHPASDGPHDTGGLPRHNLGANDGLRCDLRPVPQRASRLTTHPQIARAVPCPGTGHRPSLCLC